MNENQRKAVYGVVTALLAVLTVYGVVDETQATAIAGLAAGALTTLLAFFNTGVGTGGKHRDDSAE